LVEVNTAQQYYITTTATPADDRPRVLKYGDLFAVFNRHGDVEPTGLGEEGLFYEGTRFLSKLVLRIGNARPLLLSSTISRDNFLFTADLTNVDVLEEDEVKIPRGTLHLHRCKFLWRGTSYEKFRITNYGLAAISVPLRLTFDADFADIFEVRGTRRERRGQRLPVSVEDDNVVISYEGLDGILRHSQIRCTPRPEQMSSSELILRAALHPKEGMSFYVTTRCVSDHQPVIDYDAAFVAAKRELKEDQRIGWQIHSSNEQFNSWVGRSLADVQMMIEGNPEDGYPYAGVPWFNTVFGRDGIITALECLWLTPSIAKGVLQYLAARQATAVEPEADAEPGKILHEMRRGEMAALGEVPFGLYYGSVDSTPLFVMLAAAYYQRTGDRAFLQMLWPHIEAALDWMDDFGDEDGDGFVEYARRSSRGLLQQGWKDSQDSVFHADGRLAEGPIALCEVQGYVYAAKKWAGELAKLLGNSEKAAALEAQARALQVKFEQEFWCPEIRMYALALDGKKRKCQVRTSNAGHCLFTGIADPEKARQVAQELMGPDFFSGWGMRTVGAREARYNPISYHNGSVWPHDNAMIASGLSKYGLKEMAGRVLSGLLDASVFMDLQRLPELFCGLHRRPAEGPTLYPVACSPQAWAAGSVFLLLQACLGLAIDGSKRQILLESPYLPEDIRQLWIKGLEVSGGRVDLFLEWRPEGVRVHVLENKGQIEVNVT
jgi:glycogen debranching enzyme